MGGTYFWALVTDCSKVFNFSKDNIFFYTQHPTNLFSEHREMLGHLTKTTMENLSSSYQRLNVGREASQVLYFTQSSWTVESFKECLFETLLQSTRLRRNVVVLCRKKIYIICRKCLISYLFHFVCWTLPDFHRNYVQFDILYRWKCINKLERAITIRRIFKQAPNQHRRMS